MSILKVNDFWKSGEKYIATSRYKSLLLYENKFYVCIESHESGNTFNENIDKFLLVSGGTDRYAGEWDLSIGNTVIAEAVPDPSLSSGFIKLNDAEFQFTGDVTPVPLSGSYLDYVVANGASPINSGIRWGTVYRPEFDANNNNIIFGFCKNTQSPLQIVNPLLSGNSPIPVSGVLFFISSYGARLQLIAYFMSELLDVQTQDYTQLTQLTFFEDVLSETIPVGTPIHFGLDTSTGDVFIQIDNNPPITAIKNVDNGTVNNGAVPFDLSGFTSDTFAPFYMPIWGNTPVFSATNPQSFKYDLGSTADGKLPFLSQTIVATIPANAKDGDIYECVNGSATINNSFVQSGDFVEFADNLSKLIIIRKPKTTAQIEVIVQDKIDAAFQPKNAVTQVINMSSSSTGEETVNVTTDILMLNYVLSNSAPSMIIKLPLETDIPIGKRLTIVFLGNLNGKTLTFTGNTQPKIDKFGDNLNPQIHTTFEFILVQNFSSKRWARIV